ncbi:MAG: PIN domain-containing protein [Oscillospiraceae bacterium]|nr:PIN domain-containing protein [Oscillospiraceae bacterium]
MKDRVFLDTNIFVYTQSSKEPRKRFVSLDIMKRYDCCVSTQVFNEICNVMTKKLKMRIEEVTQIIEAVYRSCNTSTVSYDTIQKALRLKEQYHYSYYDSLILASALESGCQTVFTEDMRDGQTIDNRLELVNPFDESTE